MSTHSAIKIEYDRRQKDAAYRLDEKIKEVYIKIPEIEEIDRKIAAAGINNSRAIILGEQGQNRQEHFQNEIKTLNLKKAHLLRLHNYPENYLEVIYKCPRCKDTGFADGKECQCYRQQYIDILYKQSNLVFKDNDSFSNFNEDLFKDKARQSIVQIKDSCMHFIENFDASDEPDLFFTGPVGVGKTFMSRCIAREMLERGRTVLYQTAPILFDIINKHKFKSFEEDESQGEAYKSLFEVELLIIDDLGTEPSSSTRYAELLNLLNQRSERDLRTACKNIISTNLKIDEINEFYTERVASRIAGNFNMFRFIGNDLRMLRR